MQDSLSKAFWLNRDTTDKMTTHSYGDVYDSWVKFSRDQPIKILLLGVNCFGGGDIAALSSYFEQADIYAVDLAFDKIKHQVPFTRITGDAYNRNTVSLRNIDLVIDDCLHDRHHQNLAFDLYYPMLNPGGLYIIEDVWKAEFLTLYCDILIKQQRATTYAYTGLNGPDNCIGIYK